MDNCSSQIIQFSKNVDQRGDLVFFEGNKEIPFEIKRIYYLYNTAPHCQRGVHAHRTLKQVLIAIAGSFEVLVNDGHQEKVYRLDNPQQGLYIAPCVWRELKNFSPDAVCLVIASDAYDQGDYIFDFDDLLQIIKSHP